MYRWRLHCRCPSAKNPNLNFDVTGVPQPNLDDPRCKLCQLLGEVVRVSKARMRIMLGGFLKFISTKDSFDKYYAKQKNSLPAAKE